jgi:hypothetical protein
MESVNTTNKSKMEDRGSKIAILYPQSSILE